MQGLSGILIRIAEGEESLADRAAVQAPLLRPPPLEQRDDLRPQRRVDIVRILDLSFQYAKTNSCRTHTAIFAASRRLAAAKIVPVHWHVLITPV
jgi:hypothetical protein